MISASTTINSALVVVGSTTLPDAATSRIQLGTTTANLGITISSSSAYSYEQNIATIASADNSINWTYGNQAKALIVHAAPALTFSAGYPGQAIRLILCQDETPGEPTFVGSINWASTSANAFTDTPFNCDIISGLWTAGTSTGQWLLFLNSGRF